MDILEKIPVLSEECIQPPVTLTDIQKIHSSLTLDNPLTFIIFLSKRPDLEQKDKDIYLQIIKRLKENDRIIYENAIKSMARANYANLPATDVYDA